MRRADDERTATRASSLTNLGTVKHEEALNVLTKGMVNDHDPHIRRMCAIGLGKLGNKESAGVLIDGLCDADPGVRRYCAESLVRLDHKQAIPSLLMAMEANVAGDYLNRAVMTLSGQDFGFDATANSLARANAIESGFSWWALNASTLE
jgi:HEAT repeat protein